MNQYQACMVDILRQTIVIYQMNLMLMPTRLITYLFLIEIILRLDFYYLENHYHQAKTYVFRECVIMNNEKKKKEEEEREPTTTH